METDFGLLLKKQIIKQVKKSSTENPAPCNSADPHFHHKAESLFDEEERYYREDYSSLFVASKTTYQKSNSRQVLDKYESIKLELARLQLQEAKELENHKLLIDNYNSLDSLIEHVLGHMECVFLESKSSQRLARSLNSYAVQESCLDEEISSGLKKLNEKLDFSVRGEIKTKLLLSSSADKKLENMCTDFEQKQKNYKLALKNFKIILEILSVNDDSITKLKQQFDEVLMDYQHSRCILDQELPFAISERTKLLADCLNILADDYDLVKTQRNTLNGLLKGIAKKLTQEQYILVNREVFEPVPENDFA